MSKVNYFGTDGIRGRVGGDIINPEFAFKIGYAFGKVINKKYHSKRNSIVIGKDTRISCNMLESAIIEGMTSVGIDVYSADIIPTSAIAYITNLFKFSGGVVISASHNPYYDNGIKFFSGDGNKLNFQTEIEIEHELKNCFNKYKNTKNPGLLSKINNAQEIYIDFCKSTFPSNLDLEGMNIIIDCANGSAYKVAPCIFSELGANVYSIGDKPNGININENIGSLFPNILKKEVLSRHADIGIAFDGDADRLLIVDKFGNIFHGDELLYAIVMDRLQYGYVSGVVGTYMTNYGFEIQMHRLGIDFYRSEIGDRYIIEKMLMNNCLYGGENSGHLICLDKHTTGDGIISSLQVLAAMIKQKKSISEITNNLKMYPQYILNIPWFDGDNWKYNKRIMSKKLEIEKKLLNTGRILIRNSGTEPKLRLMVEAKDNKIALDCIQELDKLFT